MDSMASGNNNNNKKDAGIDLEQMEHASFSENHPNTQETVLQTIKQNPRAITYAVLMCIGPMLFGFDQVIVGLVTALPSFQ